MTSIRKEWKYKEQQKFSEELIKECGSKVLAQLLANRGITTSEEMKDFFDLSKDKLSSPYEFDDMSKVVERVEQAIQKQENIVVFGDFDADGITGTSILYKTLKYIGANVSYYVPERVSEGHGMNSSAILKLISARQAKLIITNDCGVSNLEEVFLANSFNVDTIITDHHELPEILPQAYAIINPKMLLPVSKMKDLCGAGVSYKVSCALLDYYKKSEFLEELLPLAAIGTIADLVPLKAENRLIAHLGIEAIKQKPSIAIEELMATGSSKIDENFSSETIAFSIGPRLNAIGRLDNASIAIELLTSDDPEVVKNLAKKVDQVNRKRQQMCDQVYKEACMMLRNVDLDKNKAIVLHNKSWHAGVIGIVASKLVETFYRPAFLMTTHEDQARGSARSIEGVHLFDALTSIKELFTQYGGHEMAAGFNLKLYNVQKFEKAITQEVNAILKGKDIKPAVNIDMDLQPEDLNIELINTINKMAPFGVENPSPLFSLKNLKVFNAKTMGSENNHLKVFLKSPDNQTFEAVWWQHDSVGFDRSLEAKVAFSPEINTYMGKSRLQLVINDLTTMQADDDNNKKSKNKLQWVDHRNKADVSALFKNYLKLHDANITVFIEKQDIIKTLNLECPVVNRLDTGNYQQVIIADYPADHAVFSDLIQNINPEIVYLSPFIRSKEMNEVEIVKQIIGMLKYAGTKLDGIADINKMAAKLATSIPVISAAIDLLVAVDFVRIISFKDNILKFELKNLKNSDLLQFKEMEKLKQELLKVYKFRQNLLKQPLEEFAKY